MDLKYAKRLQALERKIELHLYTLRDERNGEYTFDELAYAANNVAKTLTETSLLKKLKENRESEYNG